MIQYNIIIARTPALTPSINTGVLCQCILVAAVPEEAQRA